MMVQGGAAHGSGYEGDISGEGCNSNSLGVRARDGTATGGTRVVMMRVWVRNVKFLSEHYYEFYSHRQYYYSQQQQVGLYIPSQ